MATVKLKVNNTHYEMQCDDGQEEYLSYLGYELNKRVEDIRAKARTMPESRMFFLCSMLLLDELVTLKEKTHDIDDTLTKGLETEGDGINQDDMIAVINRFASKIEALTEKNIETIEASKHSFM